MAESFRPFISDLSSEFRIQVLEVHSQNQTTILLLATLASILLILLMLYISSVCFRGEPSEDPYPLSYAETSAYILPVSSSSGVDCSVCLSVLEGDGTSVKLSKCKHCFHADCISAWFMSRPICPVCRALVQLSVAAISSVEETRGAGRVPTEMASEMEGSRGVEVGADFGCDSRMFDGQRSLCFLGIGI